MTEEEIESETGERKRGVTRRQFLKYAGASAGLAAASLAIAKSPFTGQNNIVAGQSLTGHGHPVGIAAEAETEGGMTPMEFLTEFYRGEVDTFGTRRFTLNASSAEITVAKGVKFPAWAFGWPRLGGWAHHVPGPTLRCTEGEEIELNLINGDSHPHTIHLHGIHPAEADGVFEEVLPRKNYVFPKFKAEPFGMFLYHCHVMPVKKHISKGLYGAFIVDPPASYGARPLADYEFVMVMNGYDLDFDDENEFYSVNGIPNYYFENPINIQRGKVVRIYLVNMTEFDPVNSFHLHGNMFRLYRTGTRFTPTAGYDRSNPDIDAAVRDWLRDGPNRDPYAEITDNVFLGQGERAVLEFVPKHTGRFLFHAHQSEFLELGWTGLFNVT